MAISIGIILIFLILINKIGYAKSYFIYIAYSFFDVGYVFVNPIALKTVLLVPFLFDVLLRRRGVGTKYCLSLCSILSILSYLISTALSSNPHFPITVINCFNYFVPSFLLFYYIQSVCDIKIFVRYMYWTCILLFAYGLLEVFIGRSIIIDLINEHNNYGYNLNEAFRYGIKRVQGTFTHATTYGYFSAAMLSFFIIFIDDIKGYFGYRQSGFFFLYVSLVIMVFLSGTRSAMIPMAVAICYFYREKIRSLSGVGVLLLLTGLGYVFAEMFMSEYLNSIISSITNTNDNSIGSSGDMRNVQFAIAFEYMMQRPLFGWGTGMTFENVTTSHVDMYGAESIWMPLMIDNGILGCVAYAVCYFQSYFLMRPFCKWKILVFLLLILFTNTTTSVPGLSVSFILCLIVVIYKLELFRYEKQI